MLTVSRLIKKKINENLNNSLMLVTALNSHIGYDQAARIAKHAFEKDITLKEAAKNLNILSEKEFDNLVNANDMIRPNKKSPN